MNMSNMSIYNNSTEQLNGQICNSSSDNCINVQLQDQELWNKFAKAQTEMIVTKGGRRMFPGYRINLEGLNPNAQYGVLMDVVSVDQHRYKFQQGEWVVAGRGEPQVPQRFYLHPNSPCNGAKWMKDIVTFHKVKLTNSCGSLSCGKFFVHSMHQYQIRIHVVRTDDVSSLHLQPMSTYEFPQTKFITVTAYQNHLVTKLKIENNPFARGFRENGGKTKNFEMTSSAHCAKTKKREPMSAAFQQFQKRWKTDVNDLSPMNSSNSWSAYQPARNMSAVNLLPNYYQPNYYQNNHHGDQLSPNSCMHQAQVSPINQQNTMCQTYIPCKPQLSPNSTFQPVYQTSYQPETIYSPNMLPFNQSTPSFVNQHNQMCENGYSSTQATRFPFPPVTYSNNIEHNQLICQNLPTTNKYTFEPHLINNPNYQFTNSQSPTLSPLSHDSPIFYPNNQTVTNTLSCNHQQNSPISPFDLADSTNICENKFRSVLPSSDDGYASTSPLQQDTDIIDFDNLAYLL